MPDAPAPPKLSTNQAEKLATAAYLKQQRPQFRRANAPTSAKLGWVVPNPSYGSGYPRSRVRPTPVRLAWVVYFGSEAVFIEPYDGSVLGGIEVKGAARPPVGGADGRPGSTPSI